MTEIQEAYKEDTIGRRYHAPILSKKNDLHNNAKAEDPVTLNLNKPMGRSEFKGLSDSLKTLYIKHLRDKYNVTMVQMAEMLGYSTSGFHNIVSGLKLNGIFKRDGAPNNKKNNDAEWNSFLNNGDNPAKNEKRKANDMVRKNKSLGVCDCSFTVKGAMNVSEISEMISAMVTDGTTCVINVAIEVLDNN